MLDCEDADDIAKLDHAYVLKAVIPLKCAWLGRNAINRILNELIKQQPGMGKARVRFID